MTRILYDIVGALGHQAEAFFAGCQSIASGAQVLDHLVEGSRKITHELDALGQIAFGDLLHMPGEMTQIGLQGLEAASKAAFEMHFVVEVSLGQFVFVYETIQI